MAFGNKYGIHFKFTKQIFCETYMHILLLMSPLIPGDIFYILDVNDKRPKHDV